MGSLIYKELLNKPKYRKFLHGMFTWIGHVGICSAFMIPLIGVTVFWDVHRLVKGEDWEEGFASGLLHSLCFLPLLSYGFTAPLAALPDDRLVQAIAEGWEERPLGRKRLVGAHY